MHRDRRSGVLLEMEVGIRKRGVAKGLKVHCLFMITEVSIRCQKTGGWYTPYTAYRYPPPNTPLDRRIADCRNIMSDWHVKTYF